MKDIVIILPTYNVKEGVVETILGIKQKVPNVCIIVVDDNSPDKTGDLVRTIFRRDKRVQVITRKVKGGRGSAVIHGFKEALRNKKTKYFIEMDADICHDPKYIFPLIKKCKKNDLVVASRYMKGGKIFGWSWKRILMSKLINTLAHIFLRLPISDYTDGFRCYSRKAVEFITAQKFKSHGYVVLSETAYLCHKNGLRIGQIPIHIYFKPVSKSNLNTNEVKEAIITLFKLRFT